MIIALDYDGTYTRDPSMFNSFIAKAHNHGHTVYCVTARAEKDLGPLENSVLGRMVEIIHTDGQKKKQACTELGINIDIWIDDQPEALV